MYKPNYALFLLARIILGGLFVYSSFDKILNPERLAEIIYYYKVLPNELINIAALVLPMVELLAGLLLLVGRFTFAATLVLSALLITFAGAVGFNLARGLDFQCGCFTTDPLAQKAGINTLAEEIALLIPAAICLLGSYRKTQQ